MTQKLFSILGTVVLENNQYVKVCDIDIFHETEKLLVGYSNGNLTVWDIKTSTPENQIKDLIKNPIHHCSFLNDPGQIVVSDNKVRKT